MADGERLGKRLKIAIVFAISFSAVNGIEIMHFSFNATDVWR